MLLFLYFYILCSLTFPNSLFHVLVFFWGGEQEQEMGGRGTEEGREGGREVVGVCSTVSVGLWLPGGWKPDR